MTSPTTHATPTTAPGTPEGTLTFPPGFVWGAATAAYQIEGAATEDGRAPSIWDTFSHLPGAVVNGDSGDVACDHYHRYRDDVVLMAELNLGAYRFSTAWPRICPEPGRVNRAGLDFYSRLVDELLARGITPWLTLYHWDLPQVLEDRGGWTSREVVGHFTDYALAVHSALSDRVRHWTTLNEPWCSSFLGYAGGQHAPGRRDPQAAVSAAHHLLLAHGRAAAAIRAVDPTATIGLTVNPTVIDPADPADPADRAAARRLDAVLNRTYLDPVFRGAYATDTIEAFAAVGARLPIEDGDLEVIATGIDLLGVNYYQGHAVSARPPDPATALPGSAATRRPTGDPFAEVADAHVVSRGLPVTAMGWEVQPDGLRRLLHRLQSDYTGPAGVALVVTENGSAFDDEVADDGSVPDTDRTRYLEDHLRALHAAIEEGVDVRGYFAWSLLDNFEWAYGYAKRFGIVRVDYETQERTPKASAWRYAQVALTNRLADGGSVRP